MPDKITTESDLSGEILEIEAMKQETADKPKDEDFKLQLSTPSVRPKTPEQPRHKTIQGFVNANQDYLKGFMEGFSTRLMCQSPLQATNPYARKKSLADHVQKIMLPKIELKVQRKRDQPARLNATPKTRAILLPPVQTSHSETCVQEAMFASRQHRVSPIMWEPKVAVPHTSGRLQNPVFVCGIVTDQLSGGPFEAFLHRTDNPSAIKSMHFWHESIVYLSTKYNTTSEHYDRVRLHRARHLILHHLNVNTIDQLNLSIEVTQKLLRLLPADRGDHVLRCAQDSVMTVRFRYI